MIITHWFTYDLEMVIILARHLIKFSRLPGPGLNSPLVKFSQITFNSIHLHPSGSPRFYCLHINLGLSQIFVVWISGSTVYLGGGGKASKESDKVYFVFFHVCSLMLCCIFLCPWVTV